MAWSETPKDTFCRVVAHMFNFMSIVYVFLKERKKERKKEKERKERKKKKERKKERKKESKKEKEVAVCRISQGIYNVQTVMNNCSQNPKLDKIGENSPVFRDLLWANFLWLIRSLTPVFYPRNLSLPEWTNGFFSIPLRRSQIENKATCKLPWQINTTNW